MVRFVNEKVSMKDKKDTADLKNAFQILRYSSSPNSPLYVKLIAAQHTSSSKSFTVYAKTPQLKEVRIKNCIHLKLLNVHLFQAWMKDIREHLPSASTPQEAEQSPLVEEVPLKLPSQRQ